MLTTMLLNELQKQARETREPADQVKAQDVRLERMDAQLVAQQHEIDALEKQHARLELFNERLTTLERQARTANPEASTQ